MFEYHYRGDDNPSSPNKAKLVSRVVPLEHQHRRNHQTHYLNQRHKYQLFVGRKREKRNIIYVTIKNTWEKTHHRDEYSIQTVFPQWSQSHTVNKLLFTNWRNSRKQKDSVKQLEVLAIVQCLTHLKNNTQQKPKSKVDCNTEQNRKSLAILEQSHWKYIENSRVWTLITVWSVLRTQLFRRSILIPRVSFLYNHLLRFLNHSPVKCTIVIFNVPLCLILHLLLTQMNSHTYPQQVLHHRPLRFYLALYVLKWMFFNFGYFARMCSSISSLLTGNVWLKVYGLGPLQEWLYSYIYLELPLRLHLQVCSQKEVPFLPQTCPRTHLLASSKYRRESLLTLLISNRHWSHSVLTQPRISAPKTPRF